MSAPVAEKILDTIFDEKGSLKPGFSGIGRFRGKTNYSPDERTVLEYFFTNIDSNIGCARDTLPNELWALAMGQYARSSVTAPDRLLNLFYDMNKKDSTIVSVPALAELIRNQKDINEALASHCAKAGKFIVEYGIDYGHASLRDSGTIRMYFEGVSQRVTKFLEADRQGAYQEQSTRALPFKKENLGVPYEIRGTDLEQKLLALDEKLIQWYDMALSKLIPHLQSKYAHLKAEADMKIAQELQQPDARLPDKRWESVIGAKAFDVARYLLPQNMTTSLGITINTRRLQEQLTLWQSNPLWEMQVLGKVAQLEAMKVNPSLMKYGNRSEYYASLPERRKSLFDTFMGAPEIAPDYKHYDVQSRLLAVTPDIEEWALASILFNGSDSLRSLAQIKDHVKTLSADQRHQIAKTLLEGKKGYEEYPKDMEVGAFTFERVYDIGAYRDLQRQRGDRQQCAPYSIVGYNRPPEFSEIGMEMHFNQAMWDTLDVYEEFVKRGFPHAAECVLTMANLVRHVTTKDPVQQFYEAKLRTQPAGIDSYRLIEQQETEIVLQHMPSFRGLVHVDNEYYPLGRLPEAVNGYIREANAKRKK